VRNVQLAEAGVVLVDELIAVHLDTERRLLASRTALQRARVAAALEVLAEGLHDLEGPRSGNGPDSGRDSAQPPGPN
jgi:hypothetical protein